MAGKQVTKDRLIDSLRQRARVLRFRFLKRVHRRGRRAWWVFNRTSVARGVAVGLFFGVLVPVAQIVFAVFVAVAVRANLVATVASTFITNPVTLPFVYYGAYRIGSFLTERRGELADDMAASEEAAEQALDVADWFSTLLEWVSSIAFPFLVGLLLLALAAALLGYLLAHAAWGLYGAIFKYRKAQSNAS